MRWIVLIVDDHPLVGQALELSIRAAYPHLDVGRVTSAAEAEQYARLHGPRVKLVMLDLLLPDADGFSALLRLQQLLPDSAVAIVSSRADSHSISMARAFCVQGYLPKSAAVETLVNGVGALLRGEELFPPHVQADVAVIDFHKRVARLSAAQLRVLRAVGWQAEQRNRRRDEPYGGHGQTTCVGYFEEAGSQQSQPSRPGRSSLHANPVEVA